MPRLRVQAHRDHEVQRDGTPRRKSIAVLLLAVSCWLAVGCNDHATTPAHGTEQPADTLVATDVVGDDTNTTECSWDTLAEDWDDDGLPNGQEDANLNCEHDPGETDLRNADTDEDCLLDGDDPNPLVPDLNPRSGRTMCDDPFLIACRPNTAPYVDLVPAPAAHALIAAPAGSRSGQFVDAAGDLVAGAHFSDGSTFGFVVEVSSSQTTPPP